ncbi:uncharacterized protein [Procambarus clarkii]|uniref:uncharacterized protein n=1 Tax=Procambarus clarkii TaxID=6728 RepID=UPI003743CB84
MAEHLGVTKTLKKLKDIFTGPVFGDVKKYCKTCLSCQRASKPAPAIPRAPIEPIPAFGKPFLRILVDILDSLPRTRNVHEYLLTIKCTASRFPEAVPMRKVTSRAVLDTLQNYVAWVGIPEVIQADQWSVLQSRLFRETVKACKVEQVRSSPYHPQLKGALKRLHGTLKSLLRIYCAEEGNKWDEALPSVLFVIRDVVVESLGFTPFQLVYGHFVRSVARELARENLKTSQMEMAKYYDKRTMARKFQEGEQVLVLLLKKGKNTPSEDEEQMEIPPQTTVLCVRHEEGTEEEGVKLERADGSKMSNTDSLAEKEARLGHSEDDQSLELVEILRKNESLFTKVPRRPRGTVHEVNVGDAAPIKQHPYRVSPDKDEAMRKEERYFLDNDLAEISDTEWSSPCLHMKKSAVATPMASLLSKNKKWEWNDGVAQESFDKTKKLLTEAPVLALPDFGVPFALFVDTSDLGAGAVLTHQNDEIYRSVSFFSKKFVKHQRTYSTVEKETVALVLALKHFEIYVRGEGHIVTVYTNHNPMVFLSEMKHVNLRLTKWFLLIQEYNLKIRHIRGEDNEVADA